MDSPSRLVTFLGPGVRPGNAATDETVVPLVADVRELELSRHPVLESLRPSLAEFCAQARAVATQLGSYLPPELREPPAPQMPSFWDCYRDQFARFTVVPAIVNHEIARQALAAGARLAVLREKMDSAWWRERTGAYEAVAAAADEAQVPLRAVPGGLWRWLRDSALPLLSRAQALRAVAKTRSPETATGLAEFSAGDCDVLFLAVGATAAPIIQRVAARLAADYGLRSVAADLHFGGSTRALAGINVPLVDADPCCYCGELINGARRKWPEWWSHFREAFEETRDDLPGWQWLKPLVQRRMVVALASRAGRGLAELAAAGTIIENLAPRVVVGFHLYADMVAPLMLTAHLHGIPTVCCQHGVRGPYYRTLGSLPWDKLLVFGQYTADLLADLLDPATQVEVTGHCLYDEVATAASPEQIAALRSQLAGESRFVVLVPTQPDEYQVKPIQRRWWLEGVAAACQALGAALVLKLHPAEKRPAIYLPLARSWPNTVTILPHGGRALADLIQVCDLLVTRDSTVAYEANLWDKPVITVNLSGQRDHYPIAEDGGARAVHGYEGIEPAMRSLLTDGSAREELALGRPEFLIRHLGARDGRATERIARAIAGAVGT